MHSWRPAMIAKGLVYCWKIKLKEEGENDFRLAGSKNRETLIDELLVKIQRGLLEDNSHFFVPPCFFEAL